MENRKFVLFILINFLSVAIGELIIDELYNKITKKWIPYRYMFNGNLFIFYQKRIFSIYSKLFG